MTVQTHNEISSFIRLDREEIFEREYYISHTNKKRFSAKAILVIAIGTLAFVVPGLLLFVYYSLRTLKISHGYATLTTKRIIYYEYNTHVEENYRCVRSLHLDDLTSMRFEIDRTLISNSFAMSLFSSKRAVHVGAVGMLGFFNLFGSETSLEPGPDALEFIVDMTGAVARRKFVPDASTASGI